MPADLSSFKVQRGDPNNSQAPDFNGFVQAVEDLFNAIGDTTKNSFSPFPYLDPAQIQQGGAASGDWLAWDGANWATATPPAVTMSALADQILVAPAGSIDFQSISGSFKHLILVAYLRTDRAATEDSIHLQFNNDSGANYDSFDYEAQGTGPTQSGSEVFAGTFISMPTSIVGDTAPANGFSTMTAIIPHYANALNNKMAVFQFSKRRGTGTGNISTLNGLGAWRSNSAITRITLTPGTGPNFKAGSRLSMYGL